MSSADFQQNIRILLYALFGALGSWGVTTPDNIKSIVVSVVGFIATYLWTLYGTRLNGLLEQVKAKTGVLGVELKVDPTIIPPQNVTENTSAGIIATPAPK